MDPIEQLTKTLTKQGFAAQAGALAAALREKTLSSIVMTTEKAREAAFAPGESKIGGQPHLPAGFAWPEFNGKPLAFLAQINLSEAAGLDAQHLLPPGGILYFFHEGGEDVWGYDPKDKGGFCVTYHSGPARDLTAAPFPEGLGEDYRFPPCKLAFSRQDSFPDYGDFSYEQLPFLDSEREDYCDEIADVYGEWLHPEEGDETVNKLLGYPDLVQGDIFEEAQLVTNGLYCGDATGYNDPRAKLLAPGAAGWTLLFQIDSDDNAGMCWGDLGRIYFAIQQSDLARRNFDAVWALFQCS